MIEYYKYGVEDGKLVEGSFEKCKCKELEELSKHVKYDYPMIGDMFVDFDNKVKEAQRRYKHRKHIIILKK